MSDSTTGKISSTLEGATIAPAGPPHTYLGVARSMLPGALLLAQSPTASPLALSLVSAHVAECALKAFLSRDGSDAAVKSSTIRHNLSSLWEAAHDQGLAVSMPLPSWLIQLSGVHDSPYQMRYSTGVHGLVLPNAETMAEGVQSLVSTIEAALR
jgi:hypothetical protein